MSFSPPKKSENIPKEAQWLGGIGAGSWFYIAKKESNFVALERELGKDIQMI